MKLRRNARIFFCGKTQHGKSTLVYHLLERMNRYIYVNTKGELTPKKHGANCSTVDDVRNLLRDGCTRIIVTPRDLSENFLDELCRLVFETCTDMTLIIDEIQTYCSHAQIPHWLKILITQGEGEPRKIGVWALTQMPVRAHWDVKSQSSVIVSFTLNMKDARDLQKVQEEIPAEKIVMLPKYHFMIYDDGLPYGQRTTFYRPISLS